MKKLIIILIALFAFTLFNTKLSAQCSQDCSGNNTFLGSSAGQSNTSGNGNTFLGEESGRDNTTGSQSTYLGENAGRANTTGSFNSFVGQNSGLSNTTGLANTFTGADAGRSNTSGSRNTFVGQDAGRANTTGEFNTFIGEDAGRANSTGGFNTFIGQQAGESNTTGGANTFISRNAGNSNTTGSQNTFMGESAGFTNTTGSNNTILGENAGRSNLSGSSNVFLGDNTGFSNTTGDANVFIGAEAGISNTTGIDNTFLGDRAGVSNQTGSGNVFLGNLSGPFAGQAQNNESNRLYIDNGGGISPLIYGEFDNDIVRVNGEFHATGNVGIGTQVPIQKLEVVGAVRIGNTTTNSNGSIRYNGFNFQGHHNGQWLNLDEQAGSGGNSVFSLNGTDAFYTAGRVGIGTANPNSALHINGLANQNALRVAVGGITKMHVSTTGGVSIGTFTAPPDNGLAVSGDVGIGTSTPAQKLTVIGDASISGSLVAPSDRRLKKDIKPIEDALEIVGQLQPKTYSYKANKIVEFKLSDGLEYGLIAQEVQDVLPTLVTEKALISEEGDSYMGVEYEQLIPILLQAIKELEVEKESLMDRVESQDKTLSQIVYRLIELEGNSSTHSSNK